MYVQGVHTKLRVVVGSGLWAPMGPIVEVDPDP